MPVLAFVAGVFVGSWVGMFAMALVVAGRDQR
jgi:hypothetical protein